MASKIVRKTVLITGCSVGGIGDALAQSFHKKGLRVYATARRISKMNHLKEMGIETLELDVQNTESIEKAVEFVQKTTEGTLDILVNNAGIGYNSPLLDASLPFARTIFDVNFFGRIATTQAFMPLLLSSRGIIVNIGSIAGVSPSPWAGMYNASCAAVHQWSDTLRIELEPLGVKVVLVITGAIRTNFLSNIPGKKLAEDSMYMPIKETVESIMSGVKMTKNFESVEGYAEEVVKNALRTEPRAKLWAGGVVNLIWWGAIVMFFWPRSAELMLGGMFGINELRKKLKVAR